MELQTAKKICPVVIKTIEEAAENFIKSKDFKSLNTDDEIFEAIVFGANRQAEVMYSYDELRRIAYNAYCLGQLENPTESKYNFWVQQFKKK
jgi:hypothetical protein